MRKFKSLILISILVFSISACKNKGTKPLLPYYLGEEMHPVWILPNQGKEVFQRWSNLNLFDHDGTEIETNKIKAKAIVLQLFYGGCGAKCDLGFKAMDTLQLELANDSILLLSISIDPEKDNTTVLKKIAKQYHANASKWMLLNGESIDIDDFLKHTLQIVIEHPNSLEKINQLYLFDNQGFLRGIYDANSFVEVENIKLDTHLFR